MSVEPVIEALLSEDAVRLEGARPFAGWPAIEGVLPELTEDGKLMAVSVLAAVGAGAQLLALTGDASVLVALEAADALSRLPLSVLPPAPQILYAAAVRLSAAVRVKLYRLIGKLGDASALPLLRTLYGQEVEPVARRKLEMAAIRLGGVEERRTLVERVRGVGVRDAEEIFDDVLDANDPVALREMLSWLADERVVEVVGTHAVQYSIRVCDLAAIAADRHGLSFGQIGRLAYRPVDAALLAAARTAISELALPAEAVAVAAAPAPTAPAPTPPPKLSIFGIPLSTVTPAPSSTPRLAPEPPAPPAPVQVPPSQGRTVLSPPKVDSDPVMPFVARSPSPTSTPERASASEQRSSSYDKYVWACAWITVRPELKSQVLQRLGVDVDAWTSLQASWQSWLAGDRARWAKWCEDLEASKKKLLASSQRL
ncbi:MAG: hypothetical protein U0271_34270 [Polyangiaceae bacterium]